MDNNRQQIMAKNGKPFFLKRWMTGMTNAFDKWLFKYTPEQGETLGNTFWWVIVAGFVGGISYAIKSMNDTRTDGYGTFFYIALAVAGVLAIYYGIRNVPQMENLKKMIFRGLWILVWCAMGFGLGVTAGIFVVFAVIFIFIVWIMLKMFGVSLLEGGGGSRSSRRSNDDSNDGRVELNDGTTIEKDSTGTWRNTNSWSDTYTQHGGNTFTQDN